MSAAGRAANCQQHRAGGHAKADRGGGGETQRRAAAAHLSVWRAGLLHLYISRPASVVFDVCVNVGCSHGHGHGMGAWTWYGSMHWGMRAMVSRPRGTALRLSAGFTACWAQEPVCKRNACVSACKAVGSLGEVFVCACAWEWYVRYPELQHNHFTKPEVIVCSGAAGGGGRATFSQPQSWCAVSACALCIK